MKISQWIALGLLCAMFTLPSSAQRTAWPQMEQASRLRETGKLQMAVDLLVPLLQTDAQALSEEEAAAAWNLLGATYQDMEQYDQARRCYETAIRKLKDNPSEQAQYATTIDNLGSLELAVHHVEASRILVHRAQDIFHSLGNHAGVSRTSSNLALIALAQGDLRTSQRALSVAFREARLTTESSGEDWAAMFGVQGALAAAHGDYRSAASAYQQMIDRCIEIYGHSYSYLGTAYELLGQTQTRLGNYQEAISDFKRALAIDETVTPGKQSVRYLQTEADYGKTLRAMGSVIQGSRLEKQATNAFRDLEHHRCDGCSISVQSFR